MKKFRIGVVWGVSDWILTSNGEELKRFGPELVVIDTSDLLDEMKMVDELEAKTVFRQLKDGFGRIEVSEKEMIEAVRVYLAMRKLVSKRNLSAITIRCFDPLKNDYTACIGLGLCNDDLIPARCESDLQTILTLVVVRGTRTGEIATVTALELDTPSRKVEAIVKVISVISTSSPKGFEIEFDDPYSIQRSLCKGNVIYIVTKKPTVKMYYGDEGESDKTLSFQVICADLITDAFCAKIVEDLSEKIVYLGGDQETVEILWSPVIAGRQESQSNAVLWIAIRYLCFFYLNEPSEAVIKLLYFTDLFCALL